MLNNLANMFMLGSMGAADGNHAAHVRSGPLMLDGAVMTKSWVHTQQHISTLSSNSSQSSLIGALSGLANSM